MCSRYASHLGATRLRYVERDRHRLREFGLLHLPRKRCAYTAAAVVRRTVQWVAAHKSLLIAPDDASCNLTRSERIKSVSAEALETAYSNVRTHYFGNDSIKPEPIGAKFYKETPAKWAFSSQSWASQLVMRIIWHASEQIYHTIWTIDVKNVLKIFWSCFYVF